MQSATAQSQHSSLSSHAWEDRFPTLLFALLISALLLLSPASTHTAAAQNISPAQPRDRRPTREMVIPYHPRRPVPANTTVDGRSPSVRTALQPRVSYAQEPSSRGYSTSITPAYRSSFRSQLPVRR